MTNILNTGQELTAGQELRSNDGRFNLIMQNNGDLVLYHGTVVVWDTKTSNLPASARPSVARMQDDGNFVLYNPSNIPIWATGTQGNPGAQLILQDDRNLVLYKAGQPSVASALWSTNTVYSTPPAEIHYHEEQEVGALKWITTDTTLYRDGTLGIDAFARCSNLFSGLRPHILVVFYDSSRRAIWVSNEYIMATCCSLFDVSCASWRRQTFLEKYPEVVGRYTEGIDVYHADGESFVNLRDQFLRAIRESKEVADEIKAAINAYYP